MDLTEEIRQTISSLNEQDLQLVLNYARSLREGHRPITNEEINAVIAAHLDAYIELAKY